MNFEFIESEENLLGPVSLPPVKYAKKTNDFASICSSYQASDDGYVIESLMIPIINPDIEGRQ